MRAISAAISTAISTAGPGLVCITRYVSGRGGVAGGIGRARMCTGKYVLSVGGLR
jgi:hypothetical protein